MLLPFLDCSMPCLVHATLAAAAWPRRRLHVATHGLGSGKPLILFLHGFPETWASWRHQIQVSRALGQRVWIGRQRLVARQHRCRCFWRAQLLLPVLHTVLLACRPCRSLRVSTSWRPWTCAATARATHPRCGWELQLLRSYSRAGWQQCTLHGTVNWNGSSALPAHPLSRLPAASRVPLQGVRKYTIDHLVSDVLAVLKAAGHSKCILVGGWAARMRMLQRKLRSRVLIETLQSSRQPACSCRLAPVLFRPLQVAHDWGGSVAWHLSVLCPEVRCSCHSWLLSIQMCAVWGAALCMCSRYLLAAWPSKLPWRLRTAGLLHPFRQRCFSLPSSWLKQPDLVWHPACPTGGGQAGHHVLAAPCGLQGPQALRWQAAEAVRGPLALLAVLCHGSCC